MIKKVVLPLILAPFLMVFSDYSYSNDQHQYNLFRHLSPTSEIERLQLLLSQSDTSCHLIRRGNASGSPTSIASLAQRNGEYVFFAYVEDNRGGDPQYYGFVKSFGCYANNVSLNDYILDNDIDLIPFYEPLTDDQCMSMYGGNRSNQVSGYSSEGVYTVGGGACTISSTGTISQFCYGDDSLLCHSDSWSAVSTGNNFNLPLVDGNQSGVSIPSYLEALPGGCSDSNNCVTIDDTSYLVDWNTAPEWFSYVDTNGNTVTNPNQSGSNPADPGSGDVGGGCFTNCYPDDGSGGSDGGNDSDGSTGGGSSGGSGDGDNGNDSGGSTGGGDTGGGSTGGGDTGGGSTGGGEGDGTITVPDFEFDESGIIEAIGSSGQSISDQISSLADALSNFDGSAFDGLGSEISGLADSIDGLGTPGESCSADYPADVCEWLGFDEGQGYGDGDAAPTLDSVSNEVDITEYQEEFNSGLSSNAQCPAPQSMDLGRFGSYQVTYQPFCDFASLIRYLVLMGAYATAAYLSYRGLV